jgi:hypothetical protein
MSVASHNTQFRQSKQLRLKESDHKMIIVSNFCPVGDHWGLFATPKNDDSSLLNLRRCSDGDNKFCIVNSRGETVNHSMPKRSVSSENSSKAPTTPFICVCSNDANPFQGGTIYRVEKINDDEKYFELWAHAEYTDATFTTSTQGVVYYASTSSVPLQFDTPCKLPQLPPGPKYNKCFFLQALVRNSKRHSVRVSFQLRMPRPNVSFLRAFSVQMLRGLGYCHSRKRVSHEDIKCENIFHRNPVSMDLIMGHSVIDATQAMWDMKIEIGDFGNAQVFSDEHVTSDFRNLAWVLLRTVDFSAFQNQAIDLHEENEAKIVSACSHFDTSAPNEGCVEWFLDLVKRLRDGPLPQECATEFAEDLARTHKFFDPIRRPWLHSTCAASGGPPHAAVEQPSRENGSLEKVFGGHVTALSAEQRLLQHLHVPDDLLLLPDFISTLPDNLLLLRDFISNASLTELAQITRYGLFDQLLPLISMFMKMEPRQSLLDENFFYHVMEIAFMVLDCCSRKRNVLMHISHAACPSHFCSSFLHLLVKLAVADSAITQRLSSFCESGIQSKARHHVMNVVGKSIPYVSLDGWVQCSGCYSDDKMQSMLTHLIVMSIFDAVFPRSVLPASPPPPTLHKSSIPTVAQLLAYFTYWQAIASRGDVPNVSLCLDICYNPTVLELARAAKNGKK